MGIGAIYNKRDSIWGAQRCSKEKNKLVYNGSYKNEETAAHASDTLARKLIARGEKGHKLNFADNQTEVYAEEMKKSSNYFGVSYDKNTNKWRAQRKSKKCKKMIHIGTHKDEETAAHVS